MKLRLLQVSKLTSLLAHLKHFPSNRWIRSCNQSFSKMASSDTNNLQTNLSINPPNFNESSLPLFLSTYPLHKTECESVTKNKELTLAVITDDKKSKILLGMKKRGFGKGKWNGFGGKVEKGETIREAALREIKEECGLEASELKEVGLLEFKFIGDPVMLETHVFTTSSVSGNIMESEEMSPKWFNVSDIPFDRMWKDDKLWMPLLLSSKAFKGYFLFKGHETILDYILTPYKKNEP